MGESSDITVEILKQIRDGVRQTNERLDATSNRLDSRLDRTNEALVSMRDELGARLDRLEKRQVETEVRLATELVAVAGAVHSVREAILEDRQLRRQVADHETRIQGLEQRTG